MTDAPQAVMGARHRSIDARQSGPSLRAAARARGPSTSPSRTAPPGVLSGPIAPAMLRLALPTITVLVAQALVGVAETYFVSFLGTEALAGVALVFPVLMLVQMMSNGGIGGGVASAVARALGANRDTDAQALAWHAMLLACGLGSCLPSARSRAGRRCIGRWAARTRRSPLHSPIRTLCSLAPCRSGSSHCCPRLCAAPETCGRPRPSPWPALSFWSRCRRP
jgi:hypothetical protein